jgi:hypothetical protein
MRVKSSAGRAKHGHARPRQIRQKLQSGIDRVHVSSTAHQKATLDCSFLGDACRRIYYAPLLALIMYLNSQTSRILHARDHVPDVFLPLRASLPIHWIVHKR